MSRHLLRAYVTGMVAATATYALQSDGAAMDLVWLVIAWSTVAAVIGGIARHRPDEPGPWWLTAVGLTATGLAGIVAPASQDLPAASLRAITGDVLHLGAYLMIGGAVLWFVRRRNPDGDRDSLMDGAIVTVALATVLWSVVIDPAALGAGSSLSGRIVYIVAPVLPAGVTAVCVRLLLAAGGRLVSARLLGGAWILAFVGSVGWILALQAGTVGPGGWPDLVWIAALGCAGASALHPSMVELGRPAAGATRSASAGRLAVLGFALLATPGALLQAADAADVHTVIPIAGAGLIALLVLGRLGRLVHEREQARHELEVRASRQEVVARLGEAALRDEPLGSFYRVAADLVASSLDDVQIAIGSERSGTEPMGTRLSSLPISGGHRPGVTLDVMADTPRRLTDDERAFLASVTAVLSGVAARRRAEDDLRQRALYDDLTGLPNRVLVLERLHDAVVRRDRGHVGVLFVDLDGFKPINDEHGHEAGDALLAALAGRLSGALREGDTVGRLAGDEFVVVAPDCDEAGLAELAARLVATVREPAAIHDRLVSVTASVGTTLATMTDRDPGAVLRRADAAMYEAKAAGGGKTAEAVGAAPY